MSVLVVLALLSILAMFRTRIEFACLQFLSQSVGHGRRADAIARDLARRAEGVKLAALHVDCLDKETGGYASWIIRTTTLTNIAIDSLRRTAEASAGKESQLMEVYSLLWEKSHDERWLIHLFKLVRAGGNPRVGFGRREVDRVFAEMGRPDCMLPYDQTIPMSEDDFAHLATEYRKATGHTLSIPPDSPSLPPRPAL